MRLDLGQYGEVFSTRTRGREILEMVERELDSAATLEIDFSGVRNISYSFADEFIGELLERVSLEAHQTNVVLIHVRPNAERVIGGSLDRRGLDSTGLIAPASTAGA